MSKRPNTTKSSKRGHPDRKRPKLRDAAQDKDNSIVEKWENEQNLKDKVPFSTREQFCACDKSALTRHELIVCCNFEIDRHFVYVS